MVCFCSSRSCDGTQPQLPVNYPGDGASPVRKKRKNVQFDSSVIGGEGDFVRSEPVVILSRARV